MTTVETASHGYGGYGSGDGYGRGASPEGQAL